MDTVGKFGEILPRLGQSREPGSPGLRTRGLRLPCRQPLQVYRRRRDHMLEMGLGQPDVATATQAARTPRRYRPGRSRAAGCKRAPSISDRNLVVRPATTDPAALRRWD